MSERVTYLCAHQTTFSECARLTVPVVVELRAQGIVTDAEKEEIMCENLNHKKVDILFKLLKTRSSSTIALIAPILKAHLQEEASKIFENFPSDSEAVLPPAVVDSVSTQLNNLVLPKDEEPCIAFNHSPGPVRIVGREKEVQELLRLMREKPLREPGLKPIVVAGEDGSGKRTLALHVIHENYSSPFINKVWIPSDSEERIKDAYRNLAKHQLGLQTDLANGFPMPWTTELLRNIFDKLFQQQTILVFYNATHFLNSENEEGLPKLLPTATNPNWVPPTVLILSTSSEWVDFPNHKLDLNPFDASTAASFLPVTAADSTEESSREDSQVWTAQILQICEGSPLALNLVKCLLSEAQTQGKAYSREDCARDLLASRDKHALTVSNLSDRTNFSSSIFTVLTVLFEKIRGIESGDLTLVSLLYMAYFPEERISKTAIQTLVQNLSDGREALIFNMLEKYGLVRDFSDKFEMHRLVQKAVRISAELNLIFPKMKVDLLISRFALSFQKYFQSIETKTESDYVLLSEVAVNLRFWYDIPKCLALVEFVVETLKDDNSYRTQVNAVMNAGIRYFDNRMTPYHTISLKYKMLMAMNEYNRHHYKTALEACSATLESTATLGVTMEYATHFQFHFIKAKALMSGSRFQEAFPTLESLVNGKLPVNGTPIQLYDKVIVLPYLGFCYQGLDRLEEAKAIFQQIHATCTGATLNGQSVYHGFGGIYDSLTSLSMGCCEESILALIPKELYFESKAFAVVDVQNRCVEDGKMSFGFYCASESIDGNFIWLETNASEPEISIKIYHRHRYGGWKLEHDIRLSLSGINTGKVLVQVDKVRLRVKYIVEWAEDFSGVLSEDLLLDNGNNCWKYRDELVFRPDSPSPSITSTRSDLYNQAMAPSNLTESKDFNFLKKINSNAKVDGSAIACSHIYGRLAAKPWNTFGNVAATYSLHVDNRMSRLSKIPGAVIPEGVYRKQQKIEIQGLTVNNLVFGSVNLSPNFSYSHVHID